LKLAAIDIGSNAIRLQVVRIIPGEEHTYIKKIGYVRFPLRLGKDVFNNTFISKKTEDKFVDLMGSFRTMLRLYEVDDYIACATSAMREAANGRDLIQRVYFRHGLKIDLIAGDLEAEILGLSLAPFMDKRNIIHIDVGGGSTELNVYSKGKKINAKSFRLGTVRVLDEKGERRQFKMMKKWLENTFNDKNKEVISIGTGGNIRKLFSMSGPHEGMNMEFSKLKETEAFLKKYTYEERVHLLRMNEDRADVILPAAKIFIKVMEMCRAKIIKVPGVGLKDGMILRLYQSILKEEKIDLGRIWFS